MFNTVTIVGVGLISGSFSLALKDRKLVKKVIGVSRTEASAKRALELGLIDEVLPLKEAVQQSDLIYVAIPVDATIPVMQEVMDLVNEHQIVADAGSTKHALCDALKDHPMRNRFVATHPMWGTEYSGPESAVRDAFTGRACVICEKEKSEPQAVALIEDIYRQLGMHIIYMDADSHVRLAKSNPAMWVPIFKQNRDNVLDVLNEHISQLRKFKACLEKENYAYLLELIENANKIRRILK
jgi:prephenate dehydrogenase